MHAPVAGRFWLGLPLLPHPASSMHLFCAPDLRGGDTEAEAYLYRLAPGAHLCRCGVARRVTRPAAVWMVGHSSSLRMSRARRAASPRVCFSSAASWRLPSSCRLPPDTFCLCALYWPPFLPVLPILHRFYLFCINSPLVGMMRGICGDRLPFEARRCQRILNLRARRIR